MRGSIMIGQQLNQRYKIISLLGEGGMGEVYLAADTQTKQNVAVKILAKQLTANPDALERFRREAETLRQLDHPNIVKFLDTFNHEGQYIIVMEHLPGGSLHDLIKTGNVSVERARRITLELCDALIRSHQINVVHRDIKPENVLLDRNGKPKLADFGVARLNEGTRMTRTGTQVGTPYYMAPEAWEGKPLDAQADIWSLGVMLFEMLTGQVPFGGDSTAAVMNKVLTAQPPDLKKLRADTPPGLVKIVRRMLTRDKTRRYQTMRQVAVDLESGEPAPESMKTRIASVADISSSPGNRRNFYIAGGLIATMLIAFVWKPWSTPLTEDASTPAPTLAALPKPDWTPTLLATEPESIGGQWIAFNSRMAGSADIYLIDSEGNNLRQLTRGASHDLYPSWSPDGEDIVYQTGGSRNQNLAIVNVSTEKVRNLTDDSCNNWGPVWSPVDDWIVFYSDCDGERNVYKIRADGSDRTQLTFGSGSYNWFPAWSPDGKQITFSSNRSGKYHIYVMDADGDNVRDLAAGCVSYFSPDGKRILFGVYCDDTDDLFLIDADGSNLVALTDGWECKNATWSPDGKSIVFQLSKTTKAGPFQLYIMSLENPERSKWTLLTDFDINGGSPAWQP